MACPYMTEAQRLPVQSMRTFVQFEIRPMANLLRSGAIDHGQLLGLTQSVAEFGLPGVAVAREQGGLGVDWVTQGLLFEELVRGSVELAEQVLINTLAAVWLAKQPKVSPCYLAQLLEGRLLVGMAPGTEGLKVSLQAGGWQVDGECALAFSHPQADVLLCAVQHDIHHPDLVLLDRGKDQVELRHRHQPVGRKHMYVQVTQVLLREERGLTGAQDPVSVGVDLDALVKLHQSVAWVAHGQVALDASIKRARHTRQFGQPLAAQHLVAQQFAELSTQLEAARLMYKLGFEYVQAGQCIDSLARRARLLAADTAARIYRQVSRIDSCAGHEEAPAVQPSNLLPLFGESLADDAQRIAGELPHDPAGV